MARRGKPRLGADPTPETVEQVSAKIEAAIRTTLGNLAELFELQSELLADYPGVSFARVRLWTNNGAVYLLRETTHPSGVGTVEAVVAKHTIPIGWGEIAGCGRVGPDGVWVDDSDPVVWEVER